MKKLLLVALLFISSCSLTDEILAPPKTIRNPACKNIDSIRVFQVMDNFVLGDVCEEYSGPNYCRPENEHDVYLPKEKGEIYYDNQKIKIETGKCITYTGTYTRKIWGGDSIIPKVKIVDAEIPNPEYQEWERNQIQRKE